MIECLFPELKPSRAIYPSWKKLRVLVACEFSGIVRDAFIAEGHDAMSCDLLPTESPGPHHQGNVLDILDQGWELMIAHPPCTYISKRGAQHFLETTYAKVKGDERRKLAKQAVGFFRRLWEAPIPHIAIENPIPHKPTLRQGGIGDYHQKFNAVQFGSDQHKTICLWLKNLPPLETTKKNWDYQVVMYAIRNQKERSRFFPEVAKAMAIQWGDWVAWKESKC